VPIGPYVVDFACIEAHLVVELDGGQHAESEADVERDARLREAGYRVLRFWNHDLLRNREGVAQNILDVLEPPSP
jgi:very-short-patch-repair endonuclease